MPRLLLLWMVLMQALHLLSLLPWLRMVGFIQQEFAVPGAPALPWPWLAIGLALLYPLGLLGFSVAAWRHGLRREEQVAAILAGLPLFFSLPMLAYGLVVWLGTR